MFNNMINQDYLSICQECGCVFDYQYAFKANKDKTIKGVIVCPACKHEYESKNK